MRVLVCGCKGKYYHSPDLPKIVRNILDEHIKAGDEFLVSDCEGVDTLLNKYFERIRYPHVTTYSMFKNRESVESVETYFQMAYDCDRCVAIWDGESMEVFINMLCICALKKECKLFLTKNNRLVEIKCIDDLKTYAGSEGVITLEDVREVLVRCEFPDEMTEYLSSGEDVLSTYELVEIICGAPIPLSEKEKLLVLLGQRQNINYDALISVEENINQRNSFKNIKHDIRKVLSHNKNNDIWDIIYNELKELRKAVDYISRGNDWDFDKPMVLFDEWYDIDELRLKSYSHGLFTRYHKVLKYIRNEERDASPEYASYYRIEVWDIYDKDREMPRYDYYCYKGEICWFEKLRPVKCEDNTYYFSSNGERLFGSLFKRDLDLYTPFNPGDIVVIDCRPFGPEFHAMILETSNQWNCCFPTMVFKYPYTEEWNITTLKHKRLYKDSSGTTYAPPLSPLYRIRKVTDEEISGDDDKLFELSKIIDGSEQKAEKAWDNWHHHSKGGLTWEDMKEIFEMDESNIKA